MGSCERILRTPIPLSCECCRAILQLKDLGRDTKWIWAVLVARLRARLLFWAHASSCLWPPTQHAACSCCADTRHTSRFLLVWLLMLPFTLWAAYSWTAIFLSGQRGPRGPGLRPCSQSSLCCTCLLQLWGGGFGASPCCSCGKAGVRPQVYKDAWPTCPLRAVQESLASSCLASMRLVCRSRSHLGKHGREKQGRWWTCSAPCTGFQRLGLRLGNARSTMSCNAV